MNHWCSADPALQTFSGRAPLFPLPNLVLFPHAVVPLHIFEPRYRQMTADALAGERLIAIGLQDEVGTDAPAPSIEPMVGLGRIVAHERLDDGRYILVLRGLSRARLIREDAAELPYRVGHLEVCADSAPPEADFDRRERAYEIAALYGRLFPGSQFQRLVEQALTADLALGSVCDVISSALPISPQMAQLLLDEANSDLRSQMLWQLLIQMEPGDGAARASRLPSKPFPPGFSCN